MSFFQPFFCGHSIDCITIGSRSALQRAMANVERFYPVIAVLEARKASFQIMEEKLPSFFEGLVNASQSCPGKCCS